MYEGYWELSEPPFDNSPNPKFFYLSPEHEEALVRLVYTVSSTPCVTARAVGC